MWPAWTIINMVLLEHGVIWDQWGQSQSQATVRSLRTLEVILAEFGLYFVGSENMFEL